MKKVLVAFLMLMMMPVAWAIKVPSLYDSEALVSSQADNERILAVKQGFLDVLIKVSGEPEVENNPIIRASLQKAAYYVQEYNYAASAESSQYLLKIHYEKNDINRLLKRAGVAFWGEQRPLMLVWLTFTNAQHETEIISDDSSGGIWDVMQQQSKRFGLPLIFPVMDMTDMTQVSPRDVMAEKIPILREAAKRYMPDAILIGKIIANDDKFNSEWRLILNDSRWNWVIDGDTTGNVISSAFNQICQTFAKQYMLKAFTAVKPSLRLRVANVTARNDLAELMVHLKNMKAISHLQLTQVSSDAVEFSVRIRAPLAVFKQDIAKGEHMILTSQDFAENQFNFAWKR